MNQLSFLDPAPAPPGARQRVLMIGHSNHPWPVFEGLLVSAGVHLLVDVRSVARSRFSPQFNAKAMSEKLAAAGIGYLHVPELGGKNPRPIPELRAIVGRGLPLRDGTCLMCSEKDYRECHRHYLLAPLFIELGIEVVQLLADGSSIPDHGPSRETLRKMTGYL